MDSLANLSPSCISVILNTKRGQQMKKRESGDASSTSPAYFTAQQALHTCCQREDECSTKDSRRENLPSCCARVAL